VAEGTAAEDTIAVRDAVLALVEEQREAIILREFHGLDYQEIAAVQEVPVGTVRSRLARAREELRKTLAGPHPPSPRREP
jgi:RNA polymerase sigma-70 factor (ECF subfamily)